VNEIFRDVVNEVCVAKEGDVLWVHDYHLMLLPSMVSRRCNGGLSTVVMLLEGSGCGPSIKAVAVG
jgi:hypothetical protein